MTIADDWMLLVLVSIYMMITLGCLESLVTCYARRDARGFAIELCVFCLITALALTLGAFFSAGGMSL